jgi:serine/threonine-protein kinase HipA
MKQVTEQRFHVLLHEQQVGLIVVKDDYSRFSFTDQYIEDPDRQVLGLAFEDDLRKTHAANLKLPPWFSNLLPEGALRRQIAKHLSSSADREMMLLAQLGSDLPGAIRVLKQDEVSNENTTRLSHRTIEYPSSAPAENTDIWRFSLAGVAMKFSVLKLQDRFALPASTQSGDWIVKLPDGNYECLPQNEFAIMTLAKTVGIEVPEIRLVHRDNITGIGAEFWPRQQEYAFAIRRFDRLAGGVRVHMEDMAQVLNIYPDQKYQSSFETVAANIYRRRDIASLIEFVRRLTFNIVIGNDDAHLKNWSLLFENPRTPRLSPAYDLVCTVVYGQQAMHEKDLGMKFCGTKKFSDVSLQRFESMQRKLGIKEFSFADIAKETVKKIIENVDQIADLLKECPELLAKIRAGIIGRAGLFK